MGGRTAMMLSMLQQEVNFITFMPLEPDDVPILQFDLMWCGVSTNSFCARCTIFSSEIPRI